MRSYILVDTSCYPGVITIELSASTKKAQLIMIYVRVVAEGPLIRLWLRNFILLQSIIYYININNSKKAHNLSSSAINLPKHCCLF